MNLNQKEVEALELVLDFADRYNKEDEEKDVSEAISALRFLLKDNENENL